MEINKQYAAKAFISCSLRSSDKPFVDYIIKILDINNIQAFGTVGKFSASAENPVTLMKKNIPTADMVVICATPRYIQQDLETNKISYSLSEMIHVETGIAFAHNKPVIVFVQQGTTIGSFLPNITQYIELNGHNQDYLNKKPLIVSLLNNTCEIIKKIKNNKNVSTIGKVAVGGLAVYGGVKLIQKIYKSLTKKDTNIKNPSRKK